MARVTTREQLLKRKRKLQERAEKLARREEALLKKIAPLRERLRKIQEQHSHVSDSIPSINGLLRLMEEKGAVGYREGDGYTIGPEDWIYPRG